ncbi:peptidyl-prolyl cis-trans isomerase FKBP8-like isoform X2 [Gouania willdenowi]|nr:peptidyl-prolyl cis-trans isomerase FKBP8-like isoform X2 [Gouania willdenowi]
MKSGNEIVMDQSMRRETDLQPPADEWLDILRNGMLKKKVLQPGGGRDSWPQLGQIVKINLIKRMLDGSLIEKVPELSFTLGDGKVVKALDVAVRHMGMGETALIHVPSAIEFEVTLLEVTNAPDLKLLPPTEKIDLATCMREQGNVLVQRRDYDYATHKYDTVLQITESISKDDISSKEENELMEVKVKCLNNMAASMLKLEHYDEAHFHMDKKLALQDKYSEAIQTPREALELEPRNNTFRDEISTMMKKHRKDSEDDEKMLENLSSTHKHQAMDDKMLENPSSTHKHQAKSAWDLIWKWLLGATAVAIGGIALSVAIYARK